MRDNFRPNLRLTTNILLVIGTFLIAFNLSKISTRSRDSQIKEDCVRVEIFSMSAPEFRKKYKLIDIHTKKEVINDEVQTFCNYYF